MTNTNIEGIIVSKADALENHIVLQIGLIDSEFEKIGLGLSDLRKAARELLTLKAETLEEPNEKSIHKLYTDMLDRCSHITSYILRKLMDIQMRTANKISHINNEIFEMKHPGWKNS